MTRIFVLLLPVLFLCACSRTYYIVRHAEKASATSGSTMSSPDDPPLSREGEARAEDLRDLLKGKKIRHIYSTNTVRALSTAGPLSKATGIQPVLYDRPDSAFVQQLKDLRGNTLIIGHSNTIAPIVNGLSNAVRVGELPDTQYDDLFVVRNRMGKIKFEVRKYGKTIKLLGE